jgi:hypothetical protein
MRRLLAWARSPEGEAAWTWTCRILAVTGFLFLLRIEGLNAPWGYFILLLGLFFGPEAITGRLSFNRRRDDT